MTNDRFNWIVRNVDFDRLNDWETRFLESCERTVKAKKELSEKQEEILENLHREKT